MLVSQWFVSRHSRAMKDRGHGDAGDFPIVVMAPAENDGLAIVKILVHDLGVEAGAPALDFLDGCGKKFDRFECRIGEIQVKTPCDA